MNHLAPITKQPWFLANRVFWSCSAWNCPICSNPLYTRRMDKGGIMIACRNVRCPSDATQRGAVGHDPTRAFEHLIELLSYEAKKEIPPKE